MTLPAQEREQLRYLDLFDGVTRSLKDATPAECIYSVQRLNHTARIREVEITPEASEMMAQTLREKGYKSVADDDFELPEIFLMVPAMDVAERVEDGTICPSEEDLEKLYFGHVIDGCETNCLGIGSGKLLDVLADAHAVQRKMTSGPELQDGLDGDLPTR